MLNINIANKPEFYHLRLYKKKHQKSMYRLRVTLKIGRQFTDDETLPGCVLSHNMSMRLVQKVFLISMGLERENKE